MNSHFLQNGHSWPKRAIFKTFAGRQAMNTLGHFSNFKTLHFSAIKNRLSKL
jgi:hypothetical protein